MKLRRGSDSLIENQCVDIIIDSEHEKYSFFFCKIYLSRFYFVHHENILKLQNSNQNSMNNIR